MIRIAHFGTFDVNNYGDLLFPYVAEYRLPHYEWEHISPTENKTIFNDSLPVLSFDRAVNRNYNAILIGGGNIIHLKHNKSTVYNNIDGFAYADLWVGAAKLAMKQNIPYVFNAPGISQRFVEKFHKTIAFSTFKYSNYIAFRERFSVKLAKAVEEGRESDKVSYKVVPDTAFEIDKIWPLETKTLPEYISVNLNERYHKPIELTAMHLDRI